MTLLWVFIAASVGFALGFLVCAMCTISDYPTPYTCPVCHGHKTVSKPPWVAGDQTTWLSATSELYPCPSCNGTGIVWGDAKVDALVRAVRRLLYVEGLPSEECDADCQGCGHPEWCVAMKELAAASDALAVTS